ncbi:growth arrest-specific protein 1-like [Carcharodon carcharias]|uniref:growth arrest-specific protein 1-like n=1 Tax=Carcharodon carcharias TaxID=13397 RepID=UPI001B7DE746|nr:growth arrest-specific protein 1-like [Carcharodon carcharias]
MVRRVRLSWYSLAIFACLSSVAGAQPVCWQVLLRCQEEKDCKWAYGQYTAACEPFLRGLRRQCPSHCIGALVKLNQTQNGPDLENCDCDQDVQCRRAKRAIEPCMPRRYRGQSPDAADLGCTEARQRCEEESVCHGAMKDYLSNCGQLFNGRRCTAVCKSTIQYLLTIPNGVLLNTCVCDGVERPFCEVVKENMERFCSISSHSLFTATPDSEENYEYDDYEMNKTDLRPEIADGMDAPLNLCAGLWAHTWCSLLLLLPLLSLWFS